MQYDAFITTTDNQDDKGNIITKEQYNRLMSQ
jgi:hypothetical protein